jgi:two-component system sensor histidine kinase BaeS
VSFRLRVLMLVAVVAVTAVGATAYLAFKQASRQVTESAAADRSTTDLIVGDLVTYARRHGTWIGVPPTVEQLARTTGQRIRLVAETGEVVVDTDTLTGRTARAVSAAPTVADARPRLRLPQPPQSRVVGPPTATPELTPTGPTTSTEVPVGPEEEKSLRELALITTREMLLYRDGVRLAACTSRHGVLATISTDDYGVPVYGVSAADAPKVSDCHHSISSSEEVAQRESVNACAEAAKLGEPDTTGVRCLEQVFSDAIADIAPVPLRVYLGAVGDTTTRLAPGPVIAAAVLVALLALAGTALLSRRVLRPIGVLTRAAHRLGAGDLSLRVPAVGRDELAQLARSFNRMADSLQRGEERQRRLVADVAHELRTPLANLRGYLEALKDGVLPISPELFASLYEEAVLQQRIVDDLQDLALAEAGVLAYHMTTTDLTELLETCRSAQQAVADVAQVTLWVAADGPVVALVDPDRLRQVIGNLLANAVRATPAGGSVTLSAAGPAGGWATLVVRDTGIGIAAANLPHVFDRFWRADASRGRATGGSGLGLAIARQIVADHGGQIRVDSQPGAGTAFTITLPAGSPRAGR